ncbi:MAG: hypothetical protein DF168_01052 [Candidatus Moanabacter tarae]|uniref:Uncharacterized protein n=1 Tax=Candidatus Moanibacter tarae TaxID=2200854 RepID=A0A2Z4AEH9_9BACT|nr:MAG: hypothetical protein DF168_01052 [Candidatus Moanabacter tarae]|tara:strand:+ start:145 stop:918 length:774 start_codon:yes stop_codon:yes gene_type:complete
MRIRSALFLLFLCLFGIQISKETALSSEIKGLEPEGYKNPRQSPLIQFSNGSKASFPSLAQLSVPSLDRQTEDIRDIRNLLTIPIPWLPYAIALVVTAGILILGFFTYRWVMSHKKKANETFLPPYEQALLDLHSTRSLINSAKDKEFSSAVSDVVRYFLERQFNMPAPESTTEEFLHRITDDRLIKGKLADAFSEFLVLCDLAKFARHSHGRVGMQKLYRKAESLIEETYLKHRMQISVLGTKQNEKPVSKTVELT